MEDKKWGHRELIDDLANEMNWYKTIVLTEMAAGSRWFQEAPIPDVMAIDKSYTRTNVRIYEIKVNQSDFRSDVMSQKWTSYLPYCDKFYFAIPRELKWRELVEKHTEAGVMVRGEKGWKVVRRSNKKPRKGQNEMFWMSLLFQATKEIGRVRNEQNALQKSEDYLKRLKRVKKKILGYESTYNEAIDAELKKLRDRESSIRAREGNVESEFVAQLAKTLGAGGWERTFKELLNRLIWDEMENAGRLGAKKLVDYLLEKKGGEPCRRSKK